MGAVTCVDFYRVPETGLRVDRVEGRVMRIVEQGESPIEEGATLSVGDTIAVSAGGLVEAKDLRLAGGANGRAFTFVAEDAMRSRPGRDDISEILAQFERLMGRSEDPFVEHQPPKTNYRRAVAREFARLNLQRTVALELAVDVARRLRAIPLFLSEETVFVATDGLDIRQVALLTQELRRPVNLHLVDHEMVDELLEEVFGRVGFS